MHTIDYQGERVKVRFSANALCDLEELFSVSFMDKSAGELLSGGLSFRLLRGLVWAGIRRSEPFDNLTLEHVGETLSELDETGLADLTKVIMEALNDAFDEKLTKKKLERPEKKKSVDLGGSSKTQVSA